MFFIRYLLIFVFLIVANPVLAKDKKSSKDVPKRYDRRAAEMEGIDLNGDHILDAEEIKNGVQARFKGVDTDGDGFLSPQEQKALSTNYKKNYGEAYGALVDKKMKTLNNRLKVMNKDKRGGISIKEYEDYYTQRYKKLDKDDDGSLNVREYRTDTERRKRRR